jgi:hypothetical protein
VATGQLAAGSCGHACHAGVLRLDGLLMGFVAYDCSNATNRVDAYSLLEPSACPISKHHHEFQRIIFGEIVQVKKDRKVPVFCYMII